MLCFTPFLTACLKPTYLTNLVSLNFQRFLFNRKQTRRCILKGRIGAGAKSNAYSRYQKPTEEVLPETLSYRLKTLLNGQQRKLGNHAANNRPDVSVM